MQHQPIKETTFRATVFDPAPPANLVVVLALGLPMWVLVTLVTNGVSPALVLTVIAMLLALGARPRRPPRDVDLTCGAGVVRLGRRGPVLRARDILGATTARVGTRVSLAIAHARRRRNPIILTLPDDASLHAVCDSLGIGHHGFGIVDACAAAPDVALFRYFASAIALVSLLFTLFVAPLGAGGPATASLLTSLATPAATLAALIAGLAALVEAGAPRPIVRLTSQGLFAPNLASGSTLVPFIAIERVEVTQGGLLLSVQKDGSPTPLVVPVRRSRWIREGMDHLELEHMAAQIRAASERAHGLFALKDEPSAAVELLRRKAGESLRAWYSRLDSLVAGSAGYRAAALESADLWKVLEDPEAEADLRSAAARVLSRRAPEVARTRVGDVLAAVRDDRVRTRIAASLDEEALAQEEQAEALEEKNHLRRA